MIWTLSIIGFVALCLLGVAFFLRVRIFSYLPESFQSRLRYYEPLRTFESALEHGFSNSNFSLDENISSEEEARSGLDEQGLREVRVIMDAQRVNFDEARLIRQKRILRRNGIDPETGLPLDPKAVAFNSSPS